MLRKSQIYLSLKIPLIALISFSMGIGITEYYKLCFLSVSPSHLPPQNVSVCFTPNERCRNLILEAINEAKQSIYVHAYSFTDPLIANALVQAKERGVIVSVILDKSNRTGHYSQKEAIQGEGIIVKIDKTQGIAHNKVMIIDEKKIITGSYNFSTAAYKRNAENLLIIANEVLALKYIENWHSRWEKAYAD